MNRYYIDCEFDGHNGPLLSMAIVPNDGIGIHIKVIDTPDVKDQWVRNNVIPVLHLHEGYNIECELNSVGEAIRAYIGDKSGFTIVADSPVDIARFCQALSTDKMGVYNPNVYDTMFFEVLNVDCWPNNMPNAVQHNAWWDAAALRGWPANKFTE